MGGAGEYLEFIHDSLRCLFWCVVIIGTKGLLISQVGYNVLDMKRDRVAQVLRLLTAEYGDRNWQADESPMMFWLGRFCLRTHRTRNSDRALSRFWARLIVGIWG